MSKNTIAYQEIDHWIEQHFDQQISFLKALVQIPTDTPPGNNAPHAEKTAELLSSMGLLAEKYPVPAQTVQSHGLQSITNLIVRQEFNDQGSRSCAVKQMKAKQGLTIALNAHGDVVPPGEGWSRNPYGGEIMDGLMYGRASAVSKSDFSTFTFALRALQDLSEKIAHQPTFAGLAIPQGQVELHFTYDEEYGGELGPGWLLGEHLTQPDLMIAAGFSYEVVNAHNGCLQFEVTLQGKMAHAAIPESGVDALQAGVHVLADLFALNTDYKTILSKVKGIKHPYLNVGQISGGTNTNVVPGRVTFKLDRRMIPEENSHEVEDALRETITQSLHAYNQANPTQEPVVLDIKRLLLAESMKPQEGQKPLISTLQKHASSIFEVDIPVVGTPLYTDVRLYAASGVPGVIYGAGPKTVLESHAKRADERLKLDDLKRATRVIARTLYDLLSNQV
ncbi:MAG: M20/M25/M40 family metallo-hydrolase [Burkholderiaceae bacterium]